MVGAAPVAPAADIVTRWNDAHNRHDADALAADSKLFAELESSTRGLVSLDIRDCAHGCVSRVTFPDL